MRVGRKNSFFYWEVEKARKSCELCRHKKEEQNYQNRFTSSGRALKFGKIGKNFIFANIFKILDLDVFVL